MGGENKYYYFLQNAEGGYKDFRMKLDLNQESLTKGKFTLMKKGKMNKTRSKK